MITSRFEGLSPADYALPAGVEERWIGPGLVIYLDRVRRNLHRVIELAGGPDRWRAHLKGRGEFYFAARRALRRVRGLAAGKMGASS